VGGQRELRWHEPEWHVAPVRPVREPTRAHGRNPNADTNCKSNSNRNGYRHPNCNGDGYGHTDRNCYTYSYGDSKANTDSERYAHTKAPSDPTASSIMGNSRPRNSKTTEQTNVILEKFWNQEIRNPFSRKENFLLS